MPPDVDYAFAEPYKEWAFALSSMGSPLGTRSAASHATMAKAFEGSRRTTAESRSVRLRSQVIGIREELGVGGMCLAIPGELIDVRTANGIRFGTVRFAGITRDVCLECQPDAGPGDFVLVHVGFAIAKIDRDEAARAWRVLEQLGQLHELLTEDGGGA